MENSDEDIRKYGLRIYTIIKNGPMDKGGAKELTDFIIPSEEVMTRQMNFEEWVQTHANQEVTISLYSLLTKKFRDIKITTNPFGSKEGVLGASVRKENWTVASKKVLHITSVVENSFAQKELKLIPFEDYIIGVKLKSQPIIPLNQEEFSPLDILMEVIRKHKGSMMKFYIYNKNNGARDVTVTIGNDYYFTLGCEGAFGALHMFPSLESNENKIEETKGELIKEDKKDEKITNDSQVDNKIKVVQNTQNVVSKENEIDTKKEINQVNEMKKEEDKKLKESVSTTISNNNQENNNIISTNEEQKIIEINKEEKKEEEEEKLDEVNNETQHNEEQENNKNTIIEEKTVEKEEENNVEVVEQKNENGDNTENKEENNNDDNEPKEEESKTEEIKEGNMLENMIKYNENNENEEKEEENHEEKKEDDIFGEENNNNTNENKNKKRRKKKK